MANKKELVAQEVAKALSACKSIALETVDFNDPQRPKTCIEVDFPLVPINAIAALEASSGALKKPIYQMSKWWARRQSSVFRSMLIAAATKAPEDPSHAARVVWDSYYGNHEKKGAFKNLKVADIFMGGGTTVVEGSRLGMQMMGNDLNPVAWFVVKQELAEVNQDEVERLLAEIEAEVKPQIMPFYYCDGPDGRKGTWRHLPTNAVMPPTFDPLTLRPDQRHEYRYDGPEILFTFWAKHGPCQMTGCGHRTPIMTSPVIAAKTLSVKYWEHKCTKCEHEFDVEEDVARISPNAALFVTTTERSYSILNRNRGAVCPRCDHASLVKFGKAKNKQIELTLLIHPTWLKGSPKKGDGQLFFGGSAQDDAESTAAWYRERASHIRLLEVRGTLPDEVVCPETGVHVLTGKAGGTVPKKSTFSCGQCGTLQDLLDSVRATKKSAPVAPYAIQGYDPEPRSGSGGVRFFAAFDSTRANQLSAAAKEWEIRKNADLSGYWPTTEIPEGITTTVKDVLPNGHGYTHWWTLFNARQLLVCSSLLKAISCVGDYSDDCREFVMGAFQQFLRCNTMLSIWHTQNSQISAALSNSNFNTKNTSAEPSVFGPVGDGSWRSAVGGLIDAIHWKSRPWELASMQYMQDRYGISPPSGSGKSVKVALNDLMGRNVVISNGSSTDLSSTPDSSFDLVVTDPPFGDNIQYAELSDFFYVWLRCVLSNKYPKQFGDELTRKSLEAVTNSARDPNDADNYYQRLLTQCWNEAHRILKPSGILTFTFHHSEDEPWVAVLESLFDAGFYLEATYPVRSDESKGDKAQFGSQKIEYDVIHVCRKRTEQPTAVSWGRMRREVMADVRQLQAMVENHKRDGLPAADIQVIRRGKALEYFSRHYGKVFIDEGRTISVKDALIGINQLIDEDADKGKDPPPVNAEPLTRLFLRTFGAANEIKRDQLQKFLRGSITTPDEFVQRGWCSEKSKVFFRTAPLDFARDWSGKHRRRLTSDMDQALVLIGACFDGSGIIAADTLRNENFRPHVALRPLLEWLRNNGPDQATRNAASRAVSIYNTWAASQSAKPLQGTLFEEYGL